MSDRAGKPKILIVRRDNIDDLICTLPLIASIRALYPTARIDLLVNSYCAPVVANNSDVNNVYIYTKAKHKEARESTLGVYLRRFWLTLKLRALRYDWLVLANVGYLPRPLRWAKQVGAKRVVGFVDAAHVGQDKVLTDPILLDRREVRHEVEYLMQLLQPFGTVTEIPAARITPKPDALAVVRRVLRPTGDHKPLIGINISARLPSQQWPEERFIELIHQLQADARCVLFWAPGSQSNAGHPGDDEKAAEILKACVGVDITPYPTQSLSQLIAGISVTDLLVTADGGALDIGAACNKPIVALFGDSDSKQWYPWRVPHIILHPESRDVRSISAQQVSEAVRALREVNA